MQELAQPELVLLPDEHSPWPVHAPQEFHEQLPEQVRL